MDFRGEMEYEYKKLCELIERCSEIRKHLPAGRLKVQTRNGHSYYSTINGGDYKYLGVNSGQVQKYKDKYLVNKVLQNAEKDRDSLQKLMSGYNDYDPNHLMRDLPDLYQRPSTDVIHKMGYADEAKLRAYVNGNPKHEEHLIHYDSRGQRRRSKSEVTISGLYEEKNLAAAYERPLELPGYGVIYPDFTVWVPSRQKYMYHEHIGRLDDPVYMSEQIWKFKAYISCGYYPFSKVLFTFDEEDGGLDTALVSRLIDLVMK